MGHLRNSSIEEREEEAAASRIPRARERNRDSIARSCGLVVVGGDRDRDRAREGWGRCDV
jgi:hypothetical protein